MSAPERRFILDGLAVYDRPSGEDGPVVVIVHGGMDRASSFGRLVRLLPDLPVRRYDRRGYGRSAPGTAVDLDRHVADLITVIGEGPAVVFGHSIGGTIALTAAARHPDRIRAVLVYESPVPWLGTGRVSRSRMLTDLAPEEAAERFMIAMAGERIWRRLPSATREARRREGPALLADLAVADGTPRFDPRSVTVPVIVGFGGAGADHRRREAHDLAEALPDARLVEVPGADHGIHLGEPAANSELVRTLLDLVRRQPRAPLGAVGGTTRSPHEIPGDTVRP